MRQTSSSSSRLVAAVMLEETHRARVKATVAITTIRMVEVGVVVDVAAEEVLLRMQRPLTTPMTTHHHHQRPQVVMVATRKETSQRTHVMKKDVPEWRRLKAVRYKSHQPVIQSNNPLLLPLLTSSALRPSKVLLVNLKHL